MDAVPAGRELAAERKGKASDATADDSADESDLAPPSYADGAGAEDEEDDDLGMDEDDEDDADDDEDDDDDDDDESGSRG